MPRLATRSVTPEVRVREQAPVATSAESFARASAAAAGIAPGSAGERPIPGRMRADAIHPSGNVGDRFWSWSMDIMRDVFMRRNRLLLLALTSGWEAARQVVERGPIQRSLPAMPCGFAWRTFAIATARGGIAARVRTRAAGRRISPGCVLP